MSIKGYRTIGFNALMLIAVILGLNWSPELVHRYIEAGAVLWGAGNAILRAVTTTPLGKSK